ncbi:MAG: PAS domain S-box protein [Williamsia sp.]|nr:PAS domain S-box protein [Williamsia sp.]
MMEMENPGFHGQKESQQPAEAQKGDRQRFLVVGIGASAGGIQALQEFFQFVPTGEGIAYVIILHLSPNHDSKLAEVLQTASKLPVSQVTEKTRIEPDHVYVVSPNKHLMMDDEYLTVTQNIQLEDRRAPIDIFFRTLAEEHSSRAVSVILSGTGANGSMGLKRIKEKGGATFAQSPREAEFNEMPRNAIATEMVDEVLPVADIPAKIIAYKNSLINTRILEDAKIQPQDQQANLREIFSLLRQRTGHDFSNYKRPTLLRRIERRINIRSLPDLTAYVTFLQNHAEEANALLKDLLISVTNFFRDKKAFEVIEQEVIPLLLKNRTSDNQLRIWIAGCATGEEAYSLAMICAERLGGFDAPTVQIFATDIDESSIAMAREGYYTLNDAADVSPERLQRFFNKEGDGYRIRREIRETIMFARHNFLKDPPFSHLDLISCRNVLIYLNQMAQERVIETFHFALNPGGYLFLGSSESVDGASDLYAAYNREQHVFQTRLVTPRNYPIPESVPRLDVLNPKISLHLQERENRESERISFGDLHQQLLEQYAPPSLVVNEEYEIVHLTESAGRYLQISGGELSQNLLKLVRPELRLELRSALYQCVQRRAAMVIKGLKVTIADRTETIDIHLRPILRSDDAARGFILLLFEQTNDQEKEVVLLASEEPIAKHLEEELLKLKSQVRTTNEQHELQAEELKASNEELQAMNEELRSAAEELETSKEELQSINEELRTVNQELKIKIEETSISSNNLQNLIISSDIGTIFLDRSYRVVLFTPAARAIFNLIPADYGRPLSDITSRLEYENLLADADAVLQKLSTVEREVNTRDGKLYLMRITPYRTDEDRIKGVVISFIDITENRQAEKALRSVNERMRLIVESAKDYAIFTLDLTRHVNSWNQGAQAMFGYTEEEILGQSGDILFVPEDREKEAPAWEAGTAQKEGRAENERWHSRKNGERFYGSGVVTLLHDNEGNVSGFVKIMRDLTQQKQAEKALLESEDQLRISEERYRVALQSSEMAAWDWNITEKTIVWNEQYYNLLGLPLNSLENNYIIRYVHPDDQEKISKALVEAVKASGVLHEEFRVVRQDNKQQKWISIYGRVVARQNGHAARMVGVMYDITERKQLEQQKEEFIGIASHELKTPVTSIKAYGELLQEVFETDKDEQSAEMIRKLNSQVNRLNDLIGDLLDTTKISEGQLLLNLERFDLAGLIADRVDELEHLSHKHRLLFQPGAPVTVRADKERIGQVLNNLISNAFKYSPQGGDITISYEVLDHEVRLSIADQGIGIPKDMEDKVFNRFFRIRHPQANLFPGMGLGLYISAGIIRRHRGMIGVKSNQDRGSVFYFTLPYERTS